MMKVMNLAETTTKAWTPYAETSAPQPEHACVRLFSDFSLALSEMPRVGIFGSEIH